MLKRFVFLLKEIVENYTEAKTSRGLRTGRVNLSRVHSSFSSGAFARKLASFLLLLEI